MAKKQKEERPTLSFDGKEYIIEDMDEEQRVTAAEVLRFQDHVNDIQSKLRTNMFIKEQLVEGEKRFIKKYEKSKIKFREMLEPEVKADIAEAAA
jgi:hypothetical protein